MAKMEVDDVVDLSLGSGRDSALTITPATVRDLRALSHNSGLTIIPAPQLHNNTSSNHNKHNSSISSSSSACTSGTSNNSSGIGSSTSNNNNFSNATTTNVANNNINNYNNNNNNSNNNNNIASSSGSGTSSSINNGTTIGSSNNTSNTANNCTNNSSNNEESTVQRRVLRPRTEPKSYAEAPDIVLLPARMNGRQQNGNIDSETDDEEMPPYVPIKELTPAELKEREKGLRKLREDLRNEETKLVMLKKLKQSQHIMKENLIVTPPAVTTSNPLAHIPPALTSKGSLSVTAAPPNSQSTIAKGRAAAPSIPMVTVNAIGGGRQSLSSNISGNSGTSRVNNSILPPPRSSLPGGATLTPGNSSNISVSTTSHRSSVLPPRTNLPNLTITPSVTITPTTAPPSGIKPRNVSNCKVIVAVQNVLFCSYLLTFN